MVKKFSFLLLAFLLLGPVMLFACAKDDPPPIDSETTDSESVADSNTNADTSSNRKTDLSLYKIVTEANSSGKEIASARSLQSALREVGLDLSMEEDNQSVPNQEAKEILIGSTNRSETAQIFEKLPKDRGYAISFLENKIVLVARSSSFLEAAVDAFAELYLPRLNGSILSFDSPEVYYGGSCVPIPLIQNGEAAVRIVRSMGAPNETKQGALSIANRIQAVSSVSVPITDEFEDSTELKEIIIGLPDSNSRYTAIRESLSKWKVHEYGVQVIDESIFVVGHTVSSTSQACITFNRLLDKAEIVINPNTEEVDSLTLYLPEKTMGTMSDWLGDFPHYDKGTYQAAYEYDDNSVQTRYLNVDPSTLDHYIASLEAAGFSLKQDNTNNGQTGNRFVTCVGERGMIHLSYLAHNRSLNVHSNPLSNVIYFEQDHSFPNILEHSTLAVMTLDYSKHAPVNNCDPRLNAGGLCYIITLRDGRFIVLDGGCSSSNGTQDCDIIHTFLQDQTVLTDENGEKKVVIAAWIFTHDSPDHHEAFLSFVPKYCKKGTNITIERMIYNNGDESVYSEGYRDSMVTKVPALLRTYMPECKRIHPLPGQKMTFADVEIEFLYTIELLAPKMATDANDASMIFRVKIDGFTTLFTGDAVTAPSDLTAKIYEAYLKSDMMQINHHGTTGMTVALYTAVDPLYSLWSTSKTCFEARTAGVAYPVGCPSEATAKLNKRVIDELNAKHNTSDVSVHSRYADGPVEILTFHHDKTITEEIYVLPEALTPELPPFIPQGK